MAEPILGSLVPTHRLWVPGDRTEGEDAAAFSNAINLTLDESQELFLADSMTRDPATGRFAVVEAAVEESRRNGKTWTLLARVLYGTYILGTRKTVYSAHHGRTVMQVFNELVEIINGHAELRRELAAEPRRANGKEAIEFLDGRSIVFSTRTTSGGRGLDGDLVVLDEAQDLHFDHLAALMPLVLARPDPQILYAGSAGGQSSEVLGKLVRRCLAGDRGLVMHRYACSEDDDPSDPRTWAKANPALGRRIPVQNMQALYDSMPPAVFARECLGIGDYPRPAGEDWVIPEPAYKRTIDPTSAAVRDLVFTVEVAFDRQRASIGVAGRRADGRVHVEVIENQIGTRWIAPRMAQLKAKYQRLGVYLGTVIDPSSPTGSILGDLADAGVEVTTLKSQDLTQAWGGLYDAWAGTPATVLHRGAGWLTVALANASTRSLGGATTWSRQAGDVDVTPLLVITWAAHALRHMLGRPATPPARPQLARGLRGRRTSETGDLANAGF